MFVHSLSWQKAVLFKRLRYLHQCAKSEIDGYFKLESSNIFSWVSEKLQSIFHEPAVSHKQKAVRVLCAASFDEIDSIEPASDDTAMKMHCMKWSSQHLNVRPAFPEQSETHAQLQVSFSPHSLQLTDRLTKQNPQETTTSCRFDLSFLLILIFNALRSWNIPNLTNI